MPARALLTAGLAFAALVPLVVSTEAASGSGTAAAKLRIGAPAATPKQPVPGKAFSVSFRVAGAPAAGTKSVFSVTAGSTSLPHADSFRAGVAHTRVVIPANAGGKVLHVRVKVTAGGASASRNATFAVRPAALPTISIEDVSAPEGSVGSTPFAFRVSLSSASTHAVSVKYATANGTATAPADYAATSGTLTFAPGETAKAIAVAVTADTAIEPDETFSVTLSSPTGARLAQSQATGTITNDDVATPVTPGSYKGATQEGNFVFFTLHPDRTITDFRSNSLTENCSPDGGLRGSISFGSDVFPIANDGTLNAHATWSGSDVEGDVEFTSESWSVTGTFTSPTSINGSITLSDELNYQGTHYSCSGTVTWSAVLQG